MAEIIQCLLQSMNFFIAVEHRVTTSFIVNSSMLFVFQVFAVGFAWAITTCSAVQVFTVDAGPGLIETSMRHWLYMGSAGQGKRAPHVDNNNEGFLMLMQHGGWEFSFPASLWSRKTEFIHWLVPNSPCMVELKLKCLFSRVGCTPAPSYSILMLEGWPWWFCDFFSYPCAKCVSWSCESPKWISERISYIKLYTFKFITQIIMS